MDIKISEIQIIGAPISKKRPRFRRFGSVYNAQSKECEIIKWMIRSEWKLDPLEGAVHLDMLFLFPYPKSWSKKKKKVYNEIAHVVKPDIDNVIKFYLDCMNGIVFKDDKQIVSIRSEKSYTDKEGATLIEVRQSV